MAAFTGWPQSYRQRDSRTSDRPRERSDDWRGARRQVLLHRQYGNLQLEDEKIVDPAKLEPVHIAVIALK